MLKVVDQKGPLSVNVDAVLWHDYVGRLSAQPSGCAHSGL